MRHKFCSGRKRISIFDHLFARIITLINIKSPFELCSDGNLKFIEVIIRICLIYAFVFFDDTHFEWTSMVWFFWQLNSVIITYLYSKSPKQWNNVSSWKDFTQWWYHKTNILVFNILMTILRHPSRQSSTLF